MAHVLWQPHDEAANKSTTTLSRYISSAVPEKNFTSYQELHQWSVDNREKFWSSLWEFFDVKSSKDWQSILEEPNGMFMARWFEGSELNFSENLLRFRDDVVAIEFYNEAGQSQSLSYKTLYQRVAVLSHAFRCSGLKKGDRVAAVLPNIPEAIIAMLACTSIGAIWSCCSPDFGVSSLLDRFAQIKPKILLYCDTYYYKGKCYRCSEKITQLVDPLEAEQVIAIPYTTSSEGTCEKTHPVTGIEFDDYIKRYINHSHPISEINFEQLPFNHPVYILYSSGTTGPPKCIVHGAGGTLLQHLKELGLHVDLSRSDRLFYYTSTGWMMWNWQVSALALGATIVLYDGSPFYPHSDSLLRLVSDRKITIFGCSAKYISSLNKADVSGEPAINLNPLRLMLSTGSPLLAESFDYVYAKIKTDIQLCSISGGTDIISCFALGNPMSPVIRGELQGPGLGMAIEIYNQDGKSVVLEKGELVCSASFPSMPVYFWNDPENKKYHHAYFEAFPGVWAHGDYAEITGHGGMVIYGRSDATLNPGGVRIGTAEIYRQLEYFSEIEDALVVAQQWQGDQRIILFIQLKESLQPKKSLQLKKSLQPKESLHLDDILIDRIKQHIRKHTSPHHVPAKVIQIHDIPRTYNGKIAELAVGHMIHDRPVSNLSALINPESLDEYKNLEQLKS